jgi:YD repeat-containing protein
MVYDSLSRLREIRRPNQEIVASWSYDGSEPNEIGRLISAFRQSEDGSTAGNTIRYAYEPAPENILANTGNLRSISREILDGTGVERTLTTTFSFGLHGRAETVSYPSAPGTTPGAAPEVFTIRHIYDPASGALVAVRNQASSTEYWSWTEAEQGYRLKKEAFGGGVIETTRDYYSLSDDLDECMSRGVNSCIPGALRGLRTVNASTGQTLQAVSYKFDRNGNLTERSTSESSFRTNYTYDGFDQLKEESRTGPGGLRIIVETFDYDVLGNITERSSVGRYDYAGSGRPHAPDTVDGATSYQYDNRGNQYLREGPLVQGGYQLVDYNDFNMPVRITTGENDPVVTNFQYDAFENRVSKSDEGEDILYAGQLYERVATTSAVEHRYKIFALGRQVAQVTKQEIDGIIESSTTRYIHEDRLGSVSLVTAIGSSGEVVSESRGFSPFGYPFRGPHRDARARAC